MNRTPVSSSLLRGMGHEDGVLEVEFANGKVYRFADVPREIFDGVVGAESVGKAFNQFVRGQFAHERVEDEATSEDTNE